MSTSSISGTLNEKLRMRDEGLPIRWVFFLPLGVRVQLRILLVDRDQPRIRRADREIRHLARRHRVLRGQVPVQTHQFPASILTLLSRGHLTDLQKGTCTAAERAYFDSTCWAALELLSLFWE